MIDKQTEIINVLNNHIADLDGYTVMYACESGSRAWGFASPDSDYDVRFIYRRPLNWYLSIDSDRKRDTLEWTDGDFDFAGWDIRKALGLFYASNPPLMEWLNSPIVYSEMSPVITRMRNMSAGFFDVKKASYHYYHMARNNFQKYLCDEGDVWTKKYFYVLRPVLCVEWLIWMKTMPPTRFDELVDFAERVEVLPPALMPTIVELLERKMQGDEMRHGPRLPELHEWLGSKLDGVKDFDDGRHSGDIDGLNRLFRWAVME